MFGGCSVPATDRDDELSMHKNRCRMNRRWSDGHRWSDPHSTTRVGTACAVVAAFS